VNFLKKHWRFLLAITVISLIAVIALKPESAYAWSSGSHGGGGFGGGGTGGGGHYGGYSGGSSSYSDDDDGDGDSIIGLFGALIFLAVLGFNLLRKFIQGIIAIIRSSREFTLMENLTRLWSRIRPGDYMTFKGQVWQDRFDAHVRKIRKRTNKDKSHEKNQEKSDE
jgi:hypothetical protein